MLITHAIFPTKINNPSNSYQLAGRICGNIKKFKNYKKFQPYRNAALIAALGGIGIPGASHVWHLLGGE